MLLIKTGRHLATSSLFLYMLLFISCGNEEKRPDVSAIPLSLKAVRFEEDLMNSGGSPASLLRKKYPSFFDLYFFQVVRIGSPDWSLMESRISAFVSDPDIQSIYKDVKTKYADVSFIDEKLTDAFRYYHYYFPKKTIPQTMTFISGFNNAILCADSLLGIGLDMYLGKDSKYYHAMQFPVYRINKMDGAYIPSDALKGWLQSEWTEPETNADLLSHMIYEGKILYVLKKLMPETNDTLLTGYSKSQLEWCKKNEKKTWSFFIDNKLIFATEMNLIMKYVNEGPTTGGFPKESPGNLGQWMGYRIVKSYMDTQKSDNLLSLMSENDYKKVLHDSNYKPE
jgi:gliding motility-associated lipoprotein GldB